MKLKLGLVDCPMKQIDILRLDASLNYTKLLYAHKVLLNKWGLDNGQFQNIAATMIRDWQVLLHKFSEKIYKNH